MKDLVDNDLQRSDRPLEPALSSFVDRLLGLLADLAPDSEIEQTTAFLTDLDRHRTRLKSATTTGDIATATKACLETCEKYLRGSRSYVVEREAELAELIRILRDCATAMSGQSSDFNAQLLGSSQRITALAQLDDIRDLKRQLKTEVTTLRRAVDEKQRRDDETYSSLNMRVEVLQMKLVKAEEEAALDSLTRVANRRSFDRALRRMTAAARQSRMPLTLAMLDVDSFKIVNDTHGHPIGDRVLLCAAIWLGKSLRHSDFIARYGGEEFAVIMNDTTAGEVERRLTQVLNDISGRSFEYDAGAEARVVRFTLSCGAAELAPGDSEEDLLKRADDALYEAKRKGRSCVVVKKRSILSALMPRA